VRRTIPIIGIILILILSGIPTILSFESHSINQVENDNKVDWWPMFHHDLQNTGYSNSTAPNTNNTLWDINLPKNDSGTTNNPIVHNGKLYFISTTNRVYCLDSSNGEMIWIKKLGDAKNIPNSYPNNIPTIYDNKLFICGYDGKIYCLNVSNGGITWTSIPIDSARFSLKVVYDRIYVGAEDSPHRFYCLNASDGTVIWSWIMVLVPPSCPAIFDEKVYVCNLYGIVYCLDAFSGEKIWSYDTGGDILCEVSSPVVYDNKVYVIDEEGLWGGHINCLDAYNGKRLWRTWLHSGFMWHFSPTVAYGKLYIAAYDMAIYCLNADNGSIIWQRGFGGVVYTSPAIADGKLYYGIHMDSNSKTVCINADNGSFIWSYNIAGSLLETPAIADGKLYCNGGKKIYCFGDNIPPDVKMVSPKKDTLYFLGRNISFISSVIIGNINIEINALDNESGLDFVKLYIDDVEKKNFSADDSFVWRWDERTFEKHIIKAIACDKVGNIAEYIMTVWKFF